MTSRRAHLEVLEPGVGASIQDLGRPGLGRYGVTSGGALDRRALILGNRLVGNAPTAAGLEIPFGRLMLRVHRSVVIALTGTTVQASADERPLPTWHPVLLPAGSTLCLAGLSGGLRTYLAVAGGIDVPLVLSSCSTDLTGRFGGLNGRYLQAGDRLMIGRQRTSSRSILRNRLTVPPPAPSATIRILPGPQCQWFTPAAWRTLIQQPFIVTPALDRMGIRLHGTSLERTRLDDLISEGIAPGSIQVPPDGQPILLLAARQTVGGYPKIATVIGADLDSLAQLHPGQATHFTEVDLSTARQAMSDYLQSIGRQAVELTAPLGQNWTTATADSPWAVLDAVQMLQSVAQPALESLEIADTAQQFTLRLKRR